MISFGMMTALLVAMMCLVHYDLLGLYPMYPFGWHGGSVNGGGDGTHTADEPHQHQHQHQNQNQNQHQHPPPVVFDHDWLPRPGTDSNAFHRQPILLMDELVDYGEDEYENDDDYDDYEDPVTPENGKHDAVF